MMYFQPDFYGVSTRIDWDARRDEKVLVADATPALTIANDPGVGRHHRSAPRPPTSSGTPAI
jgi:hypothetical protein